MFDGNGAIYRTYRTDNNTLSKRQNCNKNKRKVLRILTNLFCVLLLTRTLTVHILFGLLWTIAIGNPPIGDCLRFYDLISCFLKALDLFSNKKTISQSIHVVHNKTLYPRCLSYYVLKSCALIHIPLIHSLHLFLPFLSLCCANGEIVIRFICNQMKRLSFTISWQRFK